MERMMISTIHKRLLENIMALEELKAKGEDKDTITDIQWFLVDLATLFGGSAYHPYPHLETRVKLSSMIRKQAPRCTFGGIDDAIR